VDAQEGHLVAQEGHLVNQEGHLEVVEALGVVEALVVVEVTSDQANLHQLWGQHLEVVAILEAAAIRPSQEAIQVVQCHLVGHPAMTACPEANHLVGVGQVLREHLACPC